MWESFYLGQLKYDSMTTKKVTYFFFWTITVWQPKSIYYAIIRLGLALKKLQHLASFESPIDNHVHVIAL